MAKRIFLLLFAGLLIRLFFSHFQYSGDVNNHLVWADGFITNPTGFFTHHFPGFNDPNYPPLAIYFFATSRLFYNLVVWLCQTLNASLSVFPSAIIPFLLSRNTEIAFLKLFPILADVGSAYLIYQLTTNRHKTLMMSLFLFNPAVIYLSAVWGQIEALPIFFCLLSLYFYRQKNHLSLYLSQLSFVFAALSKQTALWLLPLFLFMWLRSSKPLQFLKSSLVSVVAYFITFIPFINWSSTSALIQPVTIYLSTLAGSTELANDKVWNIWDMIYSGVPTLDSTYLLFLTIRSWSLIMMFLSLAIILTYYYRQPTANRLYLSLFLLSLVMFFIQTRVHEKHLYPALPFLLLLSHKRLSLIVIPITILSTFFYLNLQFALGIPFI